MLSRLALGTVQFGLKYGIANQGARVSWSEAREIVEYARQYGIETLDTAIAYGDSESVLGTIGVAHSKVITKLPAMPDDQIHNEQWVLSQVQGALKRLNLSRLYGLMLHRPAQLLEPYGHNLYQSLQEMKERRLVSKIGVSIYGPDELDQLASKGLTFDLVQAPFNIVDRRIATSGWIERLDAMGVELHTRSAFLQGLLLLPAEKRPEYFSRWNSLWKEWDAWLHMHRLTPLQAALRYALSIPLIKKVVIGADSVKHLEEIIEAAGGTLPAVPATLQSDDVALLNPANWKQE